MSKWVIDVNERWLVHDVFGREVPDDDFIERYFKSIYGVSDVYRLEQVKAAPEENERHFEVGDVYQANNGICVIITNIDNGFISCISETGAIDILEIEKDTYLIDLKFQKFKGKMLISEFFREREKINL